MFWVIILIISVLLILLGIFGYKEHYKTIDSKLEKYYREYDFTPSKTFFAEEKISGIAFDENKNELLLFCQLDSLPDRDIVKLLKPNMILEVKLLENGETVTRTSRKSQIAGMAVGSVLGAVGAIVGGLSGKQYTNKLIRELRLEFVIDDLDNPIYRVTFLKDKHGTKQNSNFYKRRYEEAYYWLKLTEVLIQRKLKEN